VAAVYARAAGRDAGDVDHATPGGGEHVRHGEFGEDEGGAQVDVYGVVPFFEGDVEDGAHSLPIPSVDHQNIGALAMLLRELLIQPVQLCLMSDVALVDGDLPAVTTILLLELANKLVKRCFIRVVRQGQTRPIVPEVTSAGCTDARVG